MKTSVKLTLDGLVTALRYRAHVAADDAQFRARRRRAEKRSERVSKEPASDNARGGTENDVASH